MIWRRQWECVCVYVCVRVKGQECSHLKQWARQEGWMPLTNLVGFTVLLWEGINHHDFLFFFFKKCGCFTMCSQIDKANVHPYNKAYYKYSLERTGHWNSIQLKIIKGCLCCPMSVRMEKQWEIFSVDTLKWITLVGNINTVHCCCTCRWMENAQIIILIAFCLNEELSIFIS